MSETNGGVVIKTEEQKRAEVRNIIIIGVNGMGELVVNAPMSNKRLCMNAIADALKTIADYEGPDVQQAPVVEVPNE